MAAYFLDSSAIVKRYVAESGSAWISDLMDPAHGHVFYVASIAGVEVVAALSRRATQTKAHATALSKAISDFRIDFSHRFMIVVRKKSSQRQIRHEKHGPPAERVSGRL